MNRMALLLCCALPGLAAFSQNDALPTIFVAPFDGDTTRIEYWQPALGQGLAEMLITELGKINKFQVLESTALEHLKDEIRLGDDGWVAKDEKVEKGGFAGADFMFRAKVTRFGAKSQGVDLGGIVPGSLGKLGVKKNTSDVRIDWRIVDVANRKIVKTGEATAAETGLGFKIGVNVSGHGGGIGFDNKEFMESALGKATVKALAKIIEDVKPVPVPASGRQRQKANVAAAQQAATDSAAAALRNTPGKVLAVPNKGVLVVSLGTKHGLKAGDKLKLYEAVELKDDKGAVVFTEEKLAGEITLDAVQEERSKATYDGAAEVKAGWVVKAN
jgi:curli biogenesis system outer membrane secretion channel CsgG